MCYHCGLPAQSYYSKSMEGVVRHFCCLGCQAVAQMIIDNGLDNFYQYREGNNLKPNSANIDYAAFDLSEVQKISWWL